MNTYLIFKALHLIAVISWMAGLLYLPRIFVYHSETSNDEVKNELEKRLFLYIMNPAMILSWLFGFLLIHSIGLQSFKELWLLVKIILVISLTFYHLLYYSCIKQFSDDNNRHSLNSLELLTKFLLFC